ncbi:UDP-phosphate alpha-N-acetylglucosaminephosphotransferase [Acetobacter fabarum]|uniref:UDP-phosphate alpha-N-acetylglucosaminephosphotransferase n=1 Tax=Acetobacter fabarum TaxID=483199 RepID=UPI00312B3881
MSFFSSILAFSCLPCAAFLCAAIVRCMIRLAVMDHPDHRSAHTIPTPKGGGIGIMVAFGLFFPVLQGMTGQSVLSFPCLMAAGALVLLCGVSWLDDLYQWHPILKFAAQTIAACLIVAGGVHLNWPTPLAGAVLSVLWLIFVCNAVNFMDGLNGLITGCMACAALCVALVAPFFGVLALQWPALLLCACLMGFLPFNFPHARIFLGDVGSQGCGLLAGTATLYIASHTTLPHGWVLGPALLFPLLYDVLFTLIRRLYMRQTLVQAHRGHLYQIIYRSAVAVPAVSLLEWGMTLWGGAVAYLVAPTAGVWSGMAGATLLVLPQLTWTLFGVLRARQHAIGRW